MICRPDDRQLRARARLRLEIDAIRLLHPQRLLFHNSVP
jgi:hypothetical protein